MLSSLAHFVVRRSRSVLALALIVVVISGALAAGVFSRLGTAGYDDPASASSQAQRLVNQNFGGQPDLVFLVSSKQGTVDAATVKASGAALTQRLSHEPALSGITSYFTTPAPSLRSRDGTEALVLAHVTGPDKGIDERAGEILDRYNESSDGVTSVLVGGPRGLDLGRQTTKDVALAESIAIPVTLALLLIIFGSAVAALLPLAVAVFAMVTTMAELFVLTQFTDVSVFAINLITALGLGLGVDYALLLVSRYREELAGGADTGTAVITTLTTAGRTIVFSGITVIAALAALLAFPPYFIKSFAYAGIAVVVFAVVAALVVLPALLVVLGHRINAGALPWRKRAQRQAGQDVGRTGTSTWGRMAGFVLSRPVMIGLPVLLALLAVAAPLINLQVGNPDDRVLPAGAPAHRVGDSVRQDFDGDSSDAIDIVVVGTPDPAGLQAYAARLSALTGIVQVDTGSGTWTKGARSGSDPAPNLLGQGQQRIIAVIDPDPASAAAKSIVEQARVLSAPAGTTALVGGPTALLIDGTAAVTDHLVTAAAIVLITTLIMLFLLTGSIVHPIRAVLSNLITLAATMGIAVWVFQFGHGASLLGFTGTPLNTAILLLTVCVAFGLSMDYEVFLMSRITEARDHGQSSADAVVTGVGKTGRIITSCAILLAVSFFTFVTGQVSMIQLLGLATGLAILIDATLVRAVLVPAFMGLAGEKAWYAPQFLTRIHNRLGISESGPATSPVAVPVAVPVTVAASSEG
jgi:RND superfamily putative drug exporter